MQPFVDGNGRTARALFYWYMLKEKYWMTEYFSISRIIGKTKKSYEKTFRYAELDGNDIGYFVAYNLDVLQKAFQQLQPGTRTTSSPMIHVGMVMKLLPPPTPTMAGF